MSGKFSVSAPPPPPHPPHSLPGEWAAGPYGSVAEAPIGGIAELSSSACQWRGVAPLADWTEKHQRWQGDQIHGSCLSGLRHVWGTGRLPLEMIKVVKKGCINFNYCLIFKQKSVEIGNDLPGLKLQTLHVGGLPGERNDVIKGFVGCIQVGGRAL